jgi:hypothetical protein
MLPMAEPSTNMSPGSTSGMSAARAEENGTPVSTGAEQQRAQRGKGHAGDRHQPGRADPEQVADDHHPAAREKIGQAREQRAARNRRQVGERVGQRGEERGVGSAVDQDGDGYLGELVASEGEYLGAPQRAELADGEDLAVGRPRLRRPPMAAWMDDRGPLAFAGSPAFVPDPSLTGLGLTRLGPELRRHGLARRQASATMVGGVWPVSPSSMHMPPGCPVTPPRSSAVVITV